MLVKETLCTSCTHLNVCAFKSQYLEATKKVNKMLDDFKAATFILPFDLPCAHHIKKICNVRKGE